MEFDLSEPLLENPKTENNLSSFLLLHFGHFIDDNSPSFKTNSSNLCLHSLQQNSIIGIGQVLKGVTLTPFGWGLRLIPVIQGWRCPIACYRLLPRI